MYCELLQYFMRAEVVISQSVHAIFTLKFVKYASKYIFLNLRLSIETEKYLI
jgi:hypothetical protein